MHKTVALCSTCQIDRTTTCPALTGNKTAKEREAICLKSLNKNEINKKKFFNIKG